MTTPAGLHASCAARQGAGVLLLGPAGAGKSDLVLRLLHHGFTLVADDQVIIEDGVARAPEALAGLLEVRGLGLFRLPHAPARLHLAVRLGRAARLPEPARCAETGLPLVLVDPDCASAPDRVTIALDGVLGRAAPVAGALA